MTARPTDLTIAEYSALRAEILQTQQARMLVLGLVITLLSGLSSLVLTNVDRATTSTTVLTPGLIAFALLVVAIGAHFTAVLTRHTDTIASYIRTHIEGRYDIPMWETVWRKHRQSLRQRKRFGNLHLSQTKAFSLIYGALIIGLLVEYGIAERHVSLTRVLLVMVPAAVGLTLATDLYVRRGDRWSHPLGFPEPDDDSAGVPAGPSSPGPDRR